MPESDHPNAKRKRVLDRAVRVAPWVTLTLMSVLLVRMAVTTNDGNGGARNAIALTMTVYMLPCLYAAVRIRRVGIDQRVIRMTLFSVWIVLLAATPDSLNANKNLWAMWGWFLMPAIALLLARGSSKILTAPHRARP